MNVDQVLESRFGLRAFRPWQREAIEQLLEGKRRVLVVAPTGGGKSLCYQLPAVLLEGVTVVISPLIALMEDQVRSLGDRGIPATFLASTVPLEERRARMRAVTSGAVRLLYVAPERLRSDALIDWLGRLRPPLVAIDEAHCISQWGHDFRPDYLRIGAVIERLAPERVLACTATATPSVRDEILSRLGLSKEETAVVLRGFARPNLHFEVCEVDALGQRRRMAIDAVRQAVAAGGAAIVYAGTRKLSERTAAELSKAGVRCAAYHAGLEPAVREQVNGAFAARELDVVVATNAFGMGIDRPDIRLVTHLQTPGSIEQYYQEVGRAGRDGDPARGLLLSGASDYGLRKRLIERSQAERGEMADGARDDGAWFEWQWRMFLDVMRYVEAGSCRHDFILRYFGDEGEVLGGCGHCDVCERLEAGASEPSISGDEQATIVRKALSGVARLNRRAGLNVLAAHLFGAGGERIERLGLHELSTHGILREHDQRWIIALLRRLITAGLVDLTPGEYPMPFLTPEGRAVMKGEAPARILVPPPSVGERAPKKKRGERLVPEVSGEQAALFEELRKVRSSLARSRNVPPYVVCHDRTLIEMATLRPSSRAALATVHGMGPARLESYGEAFLDAIRASS